MKKAFDLEANAHSIEIEIVRTETYTTVPNPNKPTGYDPVERMRWSEKLEGTCTLPNGCLRALRTSPPFLFAGRTWRVFKLLSDTRPDGFSDLGGITQFEIGAVRDSYDD